MASTPITYLQWSKTADVIMQVGGTAAMYTLMNVTRQLGFTEDGDPEFLAAWDQFFAQVKPSYPETNDDMQMGLDPNDAEGTALASDEMEKAYHGALDKLKNAATRLEGGVEEALELFHTESADILAHADQLAARYAEFHSSVAQIQQKIELLIKDFNDASIEVQKIKATAESGAQLSHSPDQSSPDQRRPRTQASEKKET